MQIHLTSLPVNTFRTVFQRLGYHPDANMKTGDESYSRRLSRGTYPRFHAYINPRNDGGIAINLHLDMKRPSYAGTHAHNAEYEGDLVQAEMERIRNVVLPS